LEGAPLQTITKHKQTHTALYHTDNTEIHRYTIQQSISIMKICAACHKDLPKDSYSKKQWKLDKCQRRCKVCITNNREVQPPPQQDNNTNTIEIIKSLDSMYLDKADEISDEELFKQPPPKEDCPICFLRMPLLLLNPTGSKYQTCCGKMICSGCCHAVAKTKKTAIPLCPFCRTPIPTSKVEMIEKEKKRVEAGDATAINNLVVCHRDGRNGYPQDHTKALDFFHRAAILGDFESFLNIGYAYENGEGVEVDMEKATHYYELAAMGGDVNARHNLGILSAKSGNVDRALKHFLIATRDGQSVSLNLIKDLYSKGHATKEDYTKALQAYQAYLNEIKSPQRDEAAAYSKEKYRYY